MRVGRCYLGAIAYALTSAFLFLAASSCTPIVAAVAIATATGLTMLTLGAAWGTCIEVARNHAGVVGAVMNTSGQVASLLIPLVVGYSVEWFNNWDFPIYMLAVHVPRRHRLLAADRSIQAGVRRARGLTAYSNGPQRDRSGGAIPAQG